MHISRAPRPSRGKVLIIAWRALGGRRPGGRPGADDRSARL
jgi:hypothetical protein